MALLTARQTSLSLVRLGACLVLLWLCACGSSGPATQVVPQNNPVPAVSTLAPASAAQGSPTFTLTVTGSDFESNSQIAWNGTALTTTYVSATQLTAQVLSSALGTVGTVEVTVVTPSPGGGTSNAVTFTITAVNPVPAVSSLSPATAAAGSPAFTLTVNGSDFVASSEVEWNGTALKTTYASALQLTASVPASDVVTSGTAIVTVVNPAPGGGTSNAQTFTVTAVNPAPAISSLSPSSIAEGATAAFTLTVSGSDFVASSTVDWNGAALTTTYVSASQLTASVPASDVTTTGTATVTVVNPTPGGGTSSGASFTITTSNPAPSISSLSPSSVAAGSTPFTLTVNGSSFVANSTVDWNGTPLTTTYVSASKLTASVPASDVTTTGTATITVVNPTPGGGTSSGSSFTITAVNPVPSISSISPSSVAAGSTAFTLTVSGSDFVASSTVDWNGTALTTTYVSASQLTASVPASDVATSGTPMVTVVNPAPGGGTSNAQTFTITAVNPAPSLSSLSPSSTTAGSAAFTLTVNGGNFVSASTVDWNGVALTTTYVSASQLTALVPASDITAAGSANITVVSPAPGGGTSGAATFTINSGTSGSGAYIRQSAQYTNPYIPHTSNSPWTVTLSNVQAGSTIYVVGTWPIYANDYANMAVSDGTNTYTQLDRYNDTTLFTLGIQGTQGMAHWYAANVPAGTYTISMAPNPNTSEDWVGVVAFEVAGASAAPVDGHTVNFQANVAPGTNTVTATVTNTNANGLLIAVTFDDIDATAPTVPLVGTGFSDAGSLWDFNNNGTFAGRAESAVISTAGSHTATFSPQEGGTQKPDYMTTAVIFDNGP